MGHACIFLYQLQEMFISVVGVYSLSEVTSVGIVKFLIDQKSCLLWNRVSQPHPC